MISFQHRNTIFFVFLVHKCDSFHILWTKARGLKREDFLTPPIVTQEIKQGFDFCAEGQCPSCINRLESHSHREETTSLASQQSRCFAQDIPVLKDEAFWSI